MERIGYFKLEGEKFSEGVFTAKGTAAFLDSIDSITKKIIHAKYPSSKDVEFEIPVKVEEGSLIVTIVAIGATTVATAYLSSFASTLAKNDAADLTSKDVLIKTIQGVKYFIKLSKHLKSTNWKNLKLVDWSKDNTTVKVVNKKNEKMEVPTEFLTLWESIDVKNSTQLVLNITEDTVLSVGLNSEPKESSATISFQDKEIFYSEEVDTSEILPELKDGEFVKLRGKITRINERHKTLGFEFKGHILTAYPSCKSLIPFKDVLVANNKEKIFSEVIMHGIVSRFINLDDRSSKPQISFSELVPTDADSQETHLKLII